jgi:hypothetical protein
MTTEIPEDVFVAIKSIVTWVHGCDGSGDVSIDDVIACDIPVLENWLTALGLLPPANTEDT